MLPSSILKNMTNICHTLIYFLGGAQKHSGKVSGVFFNTYVKNYNQWGQGQKNMPCIWEVLSAVNVLSLLGIYSTTVDQLLE